MEKTDKAQEPFTKVNSKWVTDLNAKHKTIKFLEDKMGENRDDFWHGDHFSATTPKALPVKDVIAELDFIRNKTFCSRIDFVKTIRGSAQTGKKYLHPWWCTLHGL